jgi:hypothetical protein
MVPFVALYVPLQLLAVPTGAAALPEAEPAGLALADPATAATLAEPDALVAREDAGAPSSLLAPPALAPLSFEHAAKSTNEQIDRCRMTRSALILRLGS